jgi:16S rRNA (adenine1518-N6/adenine1519-N6)-dimethyltransferase
LLPPLRDVIARHGLQARRGLGQHFLLDGNLTDRIVRCCGDLSGRSVLEVGPGPGGLTRSLLASAAARIVAVELDPRAVSALQELQETAPERLTIIEGDALLIDAVGLLPAPRVIAANLPYNVATPLLIGWLRQAAAFERMVLMFQLEVAERICAAPGTSAYGRLSVLAQFICRVDLRLRLPPSAFVPPPQVHSAVVVFDPHAVVQPAPLIAAMEQVTAAAFGQRRKMLRASLKPLGGEALLDAAGINPERRAETLTVAEFERLAQLRLAGGTAGLRAG